MRILPIVFAIAGGWALAGFSAHAGVSVSFVEPEHFSDSGLNPRDRDRNLAALEKHLGALGERHLGAGENLRIEVLDVDLAGRVRMDSRWGNDIRIADSVSWPRIRLRYTLEAGGKTTGPVVETVQDMDYLRRPPATYEGEHLKFEKRMLDEWFVARFARRKSPG
jgi:hypothetical protein